MEACVTRSLLRPRGDFLIKAGVTASTALVINILLWHKNMGGGFLGLYGLALLAVALACRRAVRRDGRALLSVGLAGICALAMVRDPGLLAWSLFWTFAGMATLMPMTARFDDAWAWLQRLVLHGLRSLTAPVIDARRVLRVRRRRERPGLRRILPQIALPLLGSVIILALLSSANPVIEQALGGLLDLSWLFPTPMRVFSWLILFICCWSLLRPRLPRFLLGTFDGHGDLALPGVTVESVRLSLIAFNALFALQNGMDLAWLWRLMPLPAGISLAEYAHRGAYPLIVTALLAGGFVLVALRPGSQTAAVPAIRRMVVLWVAQNLLLVINAALRTLDYIGAYSLTSLRIAALLWMGLVAVGLVLICWRMLGSKSSAWLINANTAFAMALLLGCSFVDLDAMAAMYNVRHARELGGGGAPIDMCYLQRMGPSALLPLAELEQHPAPEAIHLMARQMRENAQVDAINADWSLLGAMRLADVRTQLRIDALAPRQRFLENCASRDVHALRVGLGLEQVRLPLTPPAQR